MSNLPLLEEDLAIIAKLDDEPNDVGGMTAAELKNTFDKASLIIQAYINGKLVPAIEGYAVPGAGDFRADGNVPMSGNLQMGNKRITGLADPEEEADGANKRYVDAASKTVADDLKSHVDSKGNVHETQASQVPVSEEAAAEIGLNHPSMVEDALRLLSNGVGAVKDIINGVGPKYRWDMLQWGTSKLMRASYDFAFTDLARRWSFTLVQDAETGELSLGDPVEGAFPEEKTGMYFQLCDEDSNAGWSDILQWGENTTAKTQGYTATSGGETYEWDEYQLTNVYLVNPLCRCIGSVSSDVEGAYPDGEWVDGVLYKLSTQDLGLARVAHGSYTGTGEKGATAPNSLSFAFEPKLVLVTLEGAVQSDYLVWSLFLRGRPYAISHSSNYSAAASWDGNTLAWYGNNAAYQLNTEGGTYLYVAIG